MVMEYRPFKKIVKVEPKKSPQLNYLEQYEKALYDLKEDAVSLARARDDISRRPIWDKIAGDASTLVGELKRLELLYGLKDDPNFLNFQRRIESYAKIKTDGEIEEKKDNKFIPIGMCCFGILGAILGSWYGSQLFPDQFSDGVMGGVVGGGFGGALGGPLIGYFLWWLYESYSKKQREQKFNSLLTESEKMLEYLKKKQ